MGWSALPVAATACVLTLLAAEGAARLVMIGRVTPSSYDVARNPHMRRGWADYTEPREREPGQGLVVVIANSQGFLREREDGSEAYPAVLEDLLNEGGARDTIVANWSIAGGRASEYTILGARAAQHRPDVVILSTLSNNYMPGTERLPLSFWISDATDMAYLPSVRRLLPPAMLDRTSARDPERAISALTALGRARRWFVEERHENWSWTAREHRTDLVERNFALNRYNPGIGELQLAEFVETIRRASPRTRIILMDMPMARAAIDPETLVHGDRFDASLHRIAGTDDLTTALDARDVVPVATYYDQSHMDPEGHRVLAEWLLPHVRRALDEGVQPPEPRDDDRPDR